MNGYVASRREQKEPHTTPKKNSGIAKFQFQDHRPASAVQQQQMEMMHEASLDKSPPLQRKANHTGLPDNLKSGIENLSGYSMDDVKVHYNSTKPAQLNAHAYAQGTDIHLGVGQEKHLPHEAWHVVQQKQGRVQPTRQLREKVQVNDDVGLEKEADVMGAKALQTSNIGSTGHRKRVEAKSTTPAQRKIGFEMEYSVPLTSSYSADHNILTQSVANDASKKRMTTFLTGGPKYANDAHFASGTNYKVHVDHELELQWAHVALVDCLQSDGMMGEWDKDKHKIVAIPEYVTAPFDEMGTNSNTTIRNTLNLISGEMVKAHGVATNGMGPFPGTSGFYLGIPANDFIAYYERHKKNKGKLTPILGRLNAAIQDRIAPQATVGVIPSAIFTAHRNLLAKDLMTKNRGDEAISGTDALKLSIDYTVDVMESLEGNKVFRNLKEEHRLEWDELKGLVSLATNYIIGEAYYRSNGFEEFKAVKSAVPLMSKIWLHSALASAPTLRGMLTEEMIEVLIKDFQRHPYSNPNKVREKMNVDLRTHKRGKPLKADDTMLKTTTTRELLEGMFNGTPIDHRGKRFGSADQMVSAIKKASANQSGIPLEYRRLSMRPNAAGLRAALWPLVIEVRELNMRHMTDAEKENALWWTERTGYGVTSHYAGQAMGSVLNLGSYLVPSFLKGQN